MRFQWLVLAEGLAQDARGAVTLLGVEQNVQPASKLPVSTKRALMGSVWLEDGELEVGQKFALSFAVVSPSGKIVLAHTGQAVFNEPTWPGLPRSINVMADFPVTLTEYGKHVVNVTLSFEDKSDLDGSLNLYVVKPTE